MPKLVLPFTKVDNDDPGQTAAVTAVESTVSLAGGFFKIAAMGTDLLWKLGTAAVTVTSGSYLASGDQEIIEVPAGGATLRFIRSTNSSADGEINVAVVQIMEIPGQDGRQYRL